MSDSIKLILAVQKFPVLYENILYPDYHLQEDIWEKIAKKCDIHSGFEANKSWIDLVKGYVDYLRVGTNFDYENEMLFLQSYLISTQSDSDEFDEDELHRILDSDSETPALNPSPVKRNQIVSAGQGTKESRKRSRLTKEMKSVRPENAKVSPTADSSTAVDSSSTVSSNVSGLPSLQLIFLGYAKVLQDLPLPVQIKTKHKIAQIMNEAEMSLFENEDANNGSETEK